MAANGGHHIEINIETRSYKTQFIYQKHTFSDTFDKFDLSLLYKYGPFDGCCIFSGLFLKEMYIH